MVMRNKAVMYFLCKPKINPFSTNKALEYLEKITICFIPPVPWMLVWYISFCHGGGGVRGAAGSAGDTIHN